MAQVIDILLKARELVDANWTQHDFFRDAETGASLEHYRPGCGVCLLGAIFTAADMAGDDLMSDAAVDALKKVNNLSSIPNWNDNPVRVKEDVLIAIDRAIAAQKVGMPA